MQVADTVCLWTLGCGEMSGEDTGRLSFIGVY